MEKYKNFIPDKIFNQNTGKWEIMRDPIDFAENYGKSELQSTVMHMQDRMYLIKHNDGNIEIVEADVLKKPMKFTLTIKGNGQEITIAKTMQTPTKVGLKTLKQINDSIVKLLTTETEIK